MKLSESILEKMFLASEAIEDAKKSGAELQREKAISTYIVLNNLLDDVLDLEAIADKYNKLIEEGGVEE